MLLSCWDRLFGLKWSLHALWWLHSSMLFGWFTFMFALWLCLNRAHVLYASAWVASLTGWATQTNAIFTLKWLLLLSLVLSRFFTRHVTHGHQCFCVCYPTTKQAHFSREVFVVGINVNARLQMLSYIWSKILSWAYMTDIFIVFNTAPSVVSSGSPLGLEL